jgi:hypothetical protein
MSNRTNGVGGAGKFPRTTAAELASRLAQSAEAVCRHYLSNGRRHGRYWLVGDARNTPGHSLYVRLSGAESGTGAAGKWTDAASGEHGDLLDIIRESCRFNSFRDTAGEAERFLGLPANQNRRAGVSSQHDPVEAARRLFAISRPIIGTVGERYLKSRGIVSLHGTGALRFHPSCTYRPDRSSAFESWPAMVAAVTDLDGAVRAVHRTWLDTSTCAKAPVATPRRAMGDVLGHAVRFGMPDDVMAIGEGIETVLSLRVALPTMPMMAAVSASHMPSVAFPAMLKRLYIARDNDDAGIRAAEKLFERACKLGIDVLTLVPRYGDFNDDLRAVPMDVFRADIQVQIAPEDVARFMTR